MSNTVNCIAANALILRALVPGGAPTEEELASFPESQELVSLRADDSERRGKKRGQKRSGGARKKSMSGYTMFTKEQFARVKADESGEKKAVSEHMKQFAMTWKALSDSQKEVYNGRARAANEAAES